MSFDSEEFLSGTEVTGSLDTEFTPIPIDEDGNGYVASIDSIDAKEVASKKDGRLWHFFEATWIIDDERVRDATGMEQPRIRQSFILDFNDGDKLDLSKGKNVYLGRLREAVHQNDPSKPWAFSMLIGQTARVSVKHRVDEDTGRTYAEVKSVAAL